MNLGQWDATIFTGTSLEGKRHWESQMNGYHSTLNIRYELVVCLHVGL